MHFELQKPMNILLLPPRFSRLYCRGTLVAALTLAPAAPTGAVATGLIAGAYATVATDLFTCGAVTGAGEGLLAEEEEEEEEEVVVEGEGEAAAELCSSSLSLSARSLLRCSSLASVPALPWAQLSSGGRCKGSMRSLRRSLFKPKRNARGLWAHSAAQMLHSVHH